MKTCTACAEEFEDKFSSCPVDGTPLNPLTAALAAYSTQDKSSSTRQSSPLSHRRSQARSYQYQPTILSSAGLLKRLAAELKFLRSRFRNAWPDLKRDPFAFAKGAALDLGNFLGERLGARPTLVGVLTALFLVLSIVFFVLLQGNNTKSNTPVDHGDQSSVEILTLSPSEPSQILPDKGVGTGSKGRVGFDRGKGEGSRPKPKRAGGGGSGGLQDELVAQHGRIPQPSEIPAPIPSLSPARKQVLPIAGIDQAIHVTHPSAISWSIRRCWALGREMEMDLGRGQTATRGEDRVTLEARGEVAAQGITRMIQNASSRFLRSGTVRV